MRGVRQHHYIVIDATLVAPPVQDVSMTDPNPLARFDRAAAAADAAIAGVRPEQLDAPTPCTEWTVRQLLNHIVGGTRMFHSMQTGGGPVDRAADFLGDDPLAAFRASVAELRAAFAEDGALTKIVPTPFGDAPGTVLVNMRVNEMLVHGWDVARATGQSTDLAPELAAECVEEFRRMRASGRGKGMFADPTEAPAGATPADQLAAVAGRTVAGAA
jgi:uncharacterized protein (TIGR03086 family)